MEDKKKKILAKCASIGKTSKIFGRVDGKQPHLVHIGEYVVVGGESVILTHCPIRLYNRDPNIHIEDLVWIGFRCCILPGVRLRKGTLIGAASVVSESTEEYSIYAGNPAKFIRYRADGEILRSFVVKWLMKKILGRVPNKEVKWDLLTKKHISYLFPDGRYDGVDMKTILEINSKETI